MQRSLVGQGPLAGRLGSLQRRCGRGLRRLRQSGGVATGARCLSACGGAAVFASITGSSGSPDSGSSNPKLPNRGGSSKPSSSSSGKGPLDFGSPLRRCTDGLLVLNCLMFVLQWASKDALMLWGAKINSAIAAGQVWRLLTSSFLHTGAIHLLINSHTLATIGPHVELIAGGSRFMAVYLAGALAGTSASFLLTPAPSVGASAALFGLGAALGVFYWRHRASMGRRSEVMLQQLGLTLAINMAYSLASKRIDNWGHIGGMVGGAAVSWLLGPKFTRLPNGQIADTPPLPVMAYRPPGGAVDGGSGGAGGLRLVRGTS
uniref:Peptidase S54 rhomboid domain-containing protein n=1 Tax=Tetradesmus obliquus TaxID=3088 RepID=A0A383VP94_TETOB|eukprot:jgi/Sobl393_1/777/SZX67345.1